MRVIIGLGQYATPGEANPIEIGKTATPEEMLEILASWVLTNKQQSEPTYALAQQRLMMQIGVEAQQAQERAKQFGPELRALIASGVIGNFLQACVDYQVQSGLSVREAQAAVSACEDMMKSKFSYRITWDRVTPESAEEGATDGNGYVINGELVQLDMSDGETHRDDLITHGPFETLEELLKDAEDYGPWIEWSSSHPLPSDWLISEEKGKLSDGDEEVITYHLHIQRSFNLDPSFGVCCSSAYESIKLTPEQFAELRSLVKTR